MAAEPLLLGADVGTTNIRVVAFDPSGKAVAQASVPTPTHYPRPGWAHYKPEELWQSFVTALRRVTDGPHDAGHITGIAIASMGEAAVSLDADGRPTYDIIAWFDGRAIPGRVARLRVWPGSPLWRDRPLLAADLRAVQAALA